MIQWTAVGCGARLSPPRSTQGLTVRQVIAQDAARRISPCGISGLSQDGFFAKLPPVLNPFLHWVAAGGVWAPWLFLALFLAASFLMLWRLEALSVAGFHGTLLGALILPYCSGLGNIIFAVILGQTGGSGSDVMVNSLVNNLTNFTFVLGVPALIWGINLRPPAGPAKPPAAGQGNDRLDVLFTLTAALFFTAVLWVMGRKGRLDFHDGLILVGLFLFWQSFHVLEALKTQAEHGKLLHWFLPLDLLAIGAGAYGIYVSTGWLVNWVELRPAGFVSAAHLGWLSGWLMVLPNAVLAFYYGWRRQPEVVYASQVGDAHVSIPLCLGIFALYHPLTFAATTIPTLQLLLGVIVFHALFVAVFGQLPRLAGLILTAAYGYFIYTGWFK